MDREQANVVDLVSHLRVLDWTPSSDSLELSVTEELLQMSDDIYRETVRQTAQRKVMEQDRWIAEKSWDKEMPEGDRRAVRKELLTRCIEQKLDAEFVSDMKKRYDQKWFSSVSEQHLVIGSVYAQRREKILTVQKELDLVSEYADVGRVAVSVLTWQHGSLLEGASFRMKVDGDRFVRQERGGQSFLSGFVEVEIPREFPVEVAEYYAGKFIVVYPYIEESRIVKVRISGNDEMVMFMSHPFTTATGILAKSDLYSSRYDGLMILARDGREYRTKWLPSMEIMEHGEVWEMCLAPTKKLIRPRFGKTAYAQASVEGVIKSQVSTSMVIERLPRVKEQSSYKIPIVKLVNRSSKILFFSEDKLYFIREPTKRLDLIGGRQELGETPLMAAIREVAEETHITISPGKLMCIGEFRNQADGGDWYTTVYIADGSSLSRSTYVEEYVVKSISSFIRSEMGRPRQVWMSTLLQYILDVEDLVSVWRTAYLSYLQKKVVQNFFPQGKMLTLLQQVGVDVQVVALDAKSSDYVSIVRSIFDGRASVAHSEFRGSLRARLKLSSSVKRLNEIETELVCTGIIVLDRSRQYDVRVRMKES